MALTKQGIDRATFDPSGASWQWLQDDAMPGFGVRLYPSGRKSFVLRYRTREGRQRFLTIGPYGTLTVSQARDMARKELGRAIDGQDPAGARQEARRGATVGEFAEVYLERMKKKWAARTYDDYKRRIENHLVPKLGSARLESVTRPEIASLLHAIAQKSGKVESNRVHELVRAMFYRAAVWGFFPEDRPNPARGIERYKEVSRDRWLKPAEVEALMTAVRDQPDPYFRAFVPLLLLTGMRKTELLSARWENVDLERKEILLPDTKSGKPQTRKLSAPAVEILRFLPRAMIEDEDGELHPHPYLFPGTGTKSGPEDHRANFQREWNEVRTAVGLTGVTIHDLRRTAGSFMAQAGVPIAVIGEILGHQSAQVTKVYARLSEENERDALEALGEKVARLLKIKGGA